MSRLWIQLDTAVGLRCWVLFLVLEGGDGVLVVLVVVGDGGVALGVLVGVGLLGLGGLVGLGWVGWVGLGLGLDLALALEKIAAGFMWGFFILSVCLNFCSCSVLGVRGGFMQSCGFFFGFLVFDGVCVSGLGGAGLGLGLVFLVDFLSPKSDVLIRHSFPSILVNSFQVLMGLVAMLGSLGLGVVGWLGRVRLGWVLASGLGLVRLVTVAAHPWPC